MDTNQNILLLKTLVEEILDKKLNSSHDFVYLSDEIENRLNERLSVSTLKRIFGYIDGYSSVRERTLNVLSRFIGYPDFKTFEIEYCSSEEVISSQRLFTQTLTSEDLQPDSIVEIQWNPGRICFLRYLGRDNFEVIDSQNSKLCKGDRFSCSNFYINQPLILHNYIHDNQSACKFVIGSRGGLTVARVDFTNVDFCDRAVGENR